jgi:hypothetical protein
MSTSPDSFVYREFAFAILSLAAGAYTLHEGLLIDGQPPRGAVALQKRPWCVGDGSGRGDRSIADFELLPIFASGVHMKGHAPGSAPDAETMYWFEHVLVAVVDDAVVLQPQRSGVKRTNDEKCEGAASETNVTSTVDAVIAKAVAFARSSSGRTAFHGLIFSLSAVVLSRVAGGGERDVTCPAIDKTQPLPLLPLHLLETASLIDPDSTNISGSDSTSTAGSPAAQSAAYHLDNAAFGAMIHLFDAAATAAFKHNAGTLPDDLLRLIVNEHVAPLNDGEAHNGAHSTYRACVAALPALRYREQLRSVALPPGGCATITAADFVFSNTPDGGSGGDCCGLRLRASVRYDMKRASKAVYAYRTELPSYGLPATHHRATRAACRAHTAATAAAAQMPWVNAPRGVFDDGGQKTTALHGEDKGGSDVNDDDKADAATIETRFLVTRRRLGIHHTQNPDFIVAIGAGPRVSLLPALNFDIVGTHDSGNKYRYYDSDYYRVSEPQGQNVC